jgi:glycyl-tRNA synthetase
VEMTSLQGQMGCYYALQMGEPPEVATAIFEHYLPKFSGDVIPQERPGLVVGLADRIDSLVGLFAAGLAPSGNKDPFAQRRAALGLVQNLIAWDLELNLRKAFENAASHLPVEAKPEEREAALDFVIERLRNYLLEEGWRYDVVDAIVAVQGIDPAHAASAVKALDSWVIRPDWNEILPAYSRCVRITRSLTERHAVQEAVLADPAEVALYAALRVAEACDRTPGDIDDFLNAFTPMIPAINRFFDDVLVMAEDEHQRYNRLGMLQRITALANGVADLSYLEGF